MQAHTFSLYSACWEHSRPKSNTLFQNHPNLFALTKSPPASLNLIQIQPVLLPFSQIHAVSRGFTELRFLSDLDYIQILSDPLILAQIHSDLPRLSQVRSISFLFTPDSDQFKSFQIHSFSFRFTQTHPDVFRLLQCLEIPFDFFNLRQIH